MANAIKLNDRQRAAVEHERGPMLVVAGAGTGKTTVLVERIARLIETGLAAPGEILAITYTVNAAREIRRRVNEILVRRGHSESADKLEATNFHSWSYRLLKRIGRDFNVLDDADLWIYLRRKIDSDELPLRHFLRAAAPGKFLNDLQTFFSRCHDELVDAARYEAYVHDVEAGRLPLPRVAPSKQTLEREEVLARCREIAAVFRATEDMLAKDHLGTFGHMILHAIQALRGDAALLAKERVRTRFLLIDEFQDANVAQIELASLLAGEERNLFAVGDPDQAIYQFRGASSAAFREFERLYPNAARVSLVENRRSTAPILTAAFACISRNPEPGLEAREQLQSAREVEAREKGRPLKTQQVDVVPAKPVPEAEEIAAEIARRAGRPCRCPGTIHPRGWCNFAVLYRQHLHREKVISELAARGIPFVVAGQDIKDTRAVRDALALLRVVVSPLESVSLFRVASFERFHVVPDELRRALITQPSQTPLLKALERVAGGQEVLDALAEVRGIMDARQMPASTALDFAASRFGLPMSDPLEVLRDFVRRWEKKPTTKGKSAAEFLEYLDLFLESGKNMWEEEPWDIEHEAPPVPDAVRLMTVHAAKGLEFADVFVIRATSNSFPSKYKEPLFEFPAELRAHAAGLEDREALHREEERRLFYVAMTRARDNLTISAKEGTGKNKTPPGYCREILEDSISKGLARMRQPRPEQLDLAAAAAPVEVLSPIAQWVHLPALPALKDAALSASAIGTYQRCPLQFKLARDWRLPEGASAALRYGSAMHIAMKAYFDGALSGNPLAADALILVFREALAKEAIDNPLQARLYDEAGERQLRAFVERQSQQPQPAVQDTERRFDVAIEGLKVVGRMDRVDQIEGGVAITDYKSGRPWDQDMADESLQLSIYAIAARSLGMKPEKLVIHNLENDSLISTTRTESRLDDASAEVQAVANGIAAGEFPPNVKQHCYWCGFRAICPETEQPFYAAAGAATTA